MHVTKPVLNLMRSYMLNRKHAVAYDGHIYENYNLRSGVPHGCTSWVLFLTYKNELPQAVSKSNKYLFVHDMKIYKFNYFICPLRDC